MINNAPEQFTPQIAVIIPAFNAAEYIGETLRSLGEQTRKDFEVIVIDDHSLDDTIRVAESAFGVFGLHGQVVRRPDVLSKGVSNCRNHGIRIAQAKWISFLDSDDLYFPSKIEETVRMIENEGADCFAFFHASRQFEDGTGKTIKINQYAKAGRRVALIPDLLHGNFITTATVTIKKSLLEEIGLFDTTLHGVEDHMMWMLVSKRTNWVYSESILTDYRVRAQSLMGGRALSYYVAQNKNLLQSAKASGVFSPQETNMLFRHLFHHVMRHYANESINRRGWGDFLLGTGSLILNGFPDIALRILFNKLYVETHRRIAGLTKRK